MSAESSVPCAVAPLEPVTPGRSVKSRGEAKNRHRFVRLSLALAAAPSFSPAGASVTIYALVDSDGCVRYVGQTRKALSARLAEHVSRPVNLAMAGWIRSDPRVRIVMLERTPESRWERAERFWIQWFRMRGDLLNIDPGGACRTADGKPRAGFRDDSKRIPWSKAGRARRDKLEIIRRSGPVRSLSREEIDTIYGSARR